MPGGLAQVGHVQEVRCAMSSIRRSELLAMVAAALLLTVVDVRAENEVSCAASMKILCPNRAAAWKLFSAPVGPLTDVVLILQETPKSPLTGKDVPESSRIPDNDPLRIQGERMASVMRANGVPTRYAGHVQRRLDAANLPDVKVASHALILVPTGSVHSDGGVDYIALLYGPGDLTEPILQSSIRLGNDLRPRFQNIATTELVNAFVEAGLIDRTHHTIVPIDLFGF